MISMGKIGIFCEFIPFMISLLKNPYCSLHKVKKEAVSKAICFTPFHLKGVCYVADNQPFILSGSESFWDRGENRQVSSDTASWYYFRIGVRTIFLYETFP